MITFSKAVSQASVDRKGGMFVIESIRKIGDYLAI